jgi:hypothetical protein
MMRCLTGPAPMATIAVLSVLSPISPPVFAGRPATQILISPRVFSKVEPRIDAEPVGELTLKGFHRPVHAHNVVAVRPEATG